MLRRPDASIGRLAGLTYDLTKNVQLDCGCNFGLTESAPDYQPFVGLSVRY